MFNNRMIGISLAALLAATVPFAQAATAPADNAIKAAVYNIGRAETQSGRLSTSRKSAIARVRRMLEGARAQLARSGNKTHASWRAADRRLKALEQKLAALQAPAASAQAVAVKTSLSRRDLSLVQSLERQAANSIRELKKVAATEFQQQRIRTYFRQRVGGLAQQFKTIARPQDPAAAGARAQIMDLARLISEAEQTAARQVAELGDVTARFKAVETRYRTLRLPAVPSAPFGTDDVIAFAGKIAAIETRAAKDVAWLQGVKGRTSLLYDSQIDSGRCRCGQCPQT